MTTPTKAPPKPAPAETQYSPETRKFSVEEYYRMAEVGILHPDERVELIDGAIIVMAPMGNPHATAVRRLERVWHNAAGNAVTVSGQCPIRLGEYADLEPDVAILRYREDDYYGKPPSAEDVLLAIEVSDSTLDYDRGTKADIYARFDVPETWIMNLPGDCIEGFSEPGLDGYAKHTVYRRGDKISPVSLPDVEFAVDDLLPPADAAGEGEPPAEPETGRATG